jgi:hypothetical protein
MFYAVAIQARPGEINEFEFGFYKMSASSVYSGQGTWQSLGTVSTDLTGSYLNLQPRFLRDPFGTIAGNQLTTFYSQGTNDTSTWNLFQVTWTPYPTSMAFNRYFANPYHWVTTGFTPSGYGYEGTLGYLSVIPQSGTRALYSCEASGHQFVSLESGCEGQSPILGLAGYIYYPQPTGISTNALYRCRAVSGTIVDHFVSLDPGCEGRVYEGLLGYASTQQITGVNLQWGAQDPALGHLIGRPEADGGWSVNVAQDPPNNWPQYGPYTTSVPAGTNLAMWTLLIDNNSADNNPIIYLDVHDYEANAVLASRAVTRKQWAAPNRSLLFVLPFTLGTGSVGHHLEFRVFWYGHAYVKEYAVGFVQQQ